MKGIIKWTALWVFLFVFIPGGYCSPRFLGDPKVNAFIDNMTAKHGFERKELEGVFARTKYIERSVSLMDKPAEFLDWPSYMSRILTDLRTANGVKYYKKHKKSLLMAQKKYGVPSHIIAGVIGVETNFGLIPLRYRAVDALATLAFFYPRRSVYFMEELEALLLFARKTNTDPFIYMGSYAGAVGIPQFMPGNISRYAVKGNRKGNIDIINNHDDAIFSVANYLNKRDWKKGLPVAVKVKTKGQGYKRFVKSNPCGEAMTTVGSLKKSGVLFPIKVSNGAKATLFAVKTEKGEEYHAAFENFCSLYRYNPSLRYVLAVNYLGNRIGRKAGANLYRR